MASNASVAMVSWRSAVKSLMNVGDDESHTLSAPMSRRRASCSGLRTMQTSGTCSSAHNLTSIWPRFEAAAVWTRAVLPSRRIVSTIPSAVRGLTNDDAPTLAGVPSASTRHRAASTQRNWEYIAPPATAVSYTHLRAHETDSY